MKKKFWACLSAVFLLLCCAFPALAAPAVPPGTVSLRVKMAYEGQPLADVSVTLHRVGTLVETAPWIEFELAGAFADYPVSLTGLDTQGWAEAAYTLASYAAADQIAPSATAVTAEDGYASFTDLPSGLYLLQAAASADETGNTYTAAPVLLELPSYDETSHSWSTQAESVMKVERQTPIPATELGVYKIWETHGAQQPAGVTVELVSEGSVVDSVVLNESNYWRHTFTGLDSRKVYHVVERDVPAGYTVTISQHGDQYTITNTAQPEKNEPPGAQTTGLASTGPASTQTSVSPVIPQTGMLWWPVPVLSTVGVLLFALGWKLRNEQKSEK